MIIKPNLRSQNQNIEKIKPAQIRLGRTIYPPKPYLKYNEWIKYINKEVLKNK